VAYQKVTGKVAGVEGDAIDEVAVVVEVEAPGELVESGHNLYNLAVDNKSILYACCYMWYFYPMSSSSRVVGNIMIVVYNVFFKLMYVNAIVLSSFTTAILLILFI